MSIPPLSALLLLLFCLATAVAIFQLVPSGEEQEVRDRLGVSGVSEDPSPLILALRPVLLLVVPLVAWIKAPDYRQSIDKKFITAGMAGALSPNEFFAYKAVMTVVIWSLFIGLLCRLITGWDEPLWVDVAVIGLGAYFPDLWLNGAVRERQHLIRKAMPYVMDLLTLSVEAGLDFVSGIAKTCEKARRSPLIDEFSYMLGELQLGASRQQALRNLAVRTDMPETRSFSALLIQADILGASIGPVLRAQSDLIRTHRFQRAERLGAYASQKILFPLILCIMPAVFLMIFGPIFLNFLFGDSTIGL